MTPKKNLGLAEAVAQLVESLLSKREAPVNPQHRID